jgi:hypothetical protein
MGREPGHSEVVNDLLDLQARLRGDRSDPEPLIGGTMVDAPPAMFSEQPSKMPDEAAATAASTVERSDTLSVTEGDTGVVMGSLVPPAHHDPDLETLDSPTALQTREEQIADLAKRIDHLELEVTFVAEELWRLASSPAPPSERSF